MKRALLLKSRPARPQRAWLGCVVLGFLLIPACAPPPPRTVNMTLGAVNSADRILVLEGETDLPSGSRLKAEVQNRDGKSILRDEAVVRRGSFFFDFDLDRLSEFSTYRVLVVFDPEKAPLGVRLNTGLWGEALEGEGVRRLANRRIFRKEKEILLSTTAKGKDWEGRDFEEMEGNERSRLIADMERYLEETPEEKSTQLALARAYLADEVKEFSPGSRAHILLMEVARSTETDRDGQVARGLLSEIEALQKKKQTKVATQKAMADGERYKRDFTITPGTNLGGFRLGTPYRVAGRYFKLDKNVDFSKVQDDPVVRLLDFHDLELTYGRTSQRLIAVRTTSPKFLLPEGFGVGSLLQELQSAYGTQAVYTPEFESLGTNAEGKKIFRGSVLTDGLEFEIRREIDPIFGIPVDKVSAITVFR